MTLLHHILLTLLLTAGTAQAVLASESKHDHVPVRDWGVDIGLGYAAIDNPLNKREALETYVVPQWYYYGKRFYIENLELGYTLLEEDFLLLDLVGYLNDDGVLFNVDNKEISILDVSNLIPNVGRPRPGEPIEFEKIERKFSYMAGLQLFLLTDYVDLKFVYAKDVSVGHDGKETLFSLRKSYQQGDFRFFWEAGLVLKSPELNNYYYGLRAEERGLRRDTDVTDVSLTNYFVKLAGTYRISQRVTGVISLHHTGMNEDLLISPLLRKDHYLSGFVGINVHF